MAGRKQRTAPRRAARAKTAAKARQRTASPRRAATKQAAKARTPRASAPRKAQTFNVSHHRDEDFSVGLRRYAAYRDLGMAKATNGMVQAHVIRFVPPCDPREVAKLHFHDVDLQMVYVLKGWIKTELEGAGAHVMRAGSCWLQPPRIRHKVLDYSDDCEVLEIVLPADFKTVELE
ncbi:MAG TPA: cupin domain-containing protein [Xanthobacteraceae bacterium]|nr:cupin domain-containing protein [Xanthobacteraceae bacterium]